MIVSNDTIIKHFWLYLVHRRCRVAFVEPVKAFCRPIDKQFSLNTPPFITVVKPENQVSEILISWHKHEWKFMNCFKDMG